MAVSTTLGVGATGVSLFQEGLKVVSNNIANTDTIGFKENDIAFSEVIAGGIAGMGKTQLDRFQIGRGAAVNNVRNIFSQGTPTETTNVLDLTIEGEGFFMMKDPAGSTVPLFTRAGQFDDGRKGNEGREFGFVRNPDGLLLQGAKITTDPATGKKTLGKVDSIDLADHILPPSATTEAHFTLNLFANDPDTASDLIGSTPTNFDLLIGGGLLINGVGFGDIPASSDASTRMDDLIAEINLFEAVTGVSASKSGSEKLVLTSVSGGPITIEFDPSLDPDVAAKTGLTEGLFLAEGALTGNVTATAGDHAVTGVDTRFTSELSAGDTLTIGQTRYTVESVQSDTELSVTEAIDTDVTNALAVRQGAAYSTPVTVFDSLGKDHNLNLRFVKTGTNQWTWHAVVSGSENFNGSFDEVQATGLLVFTPTGELDKTKSKDASFPRGGFDFKGGALTDQKIAFNFLGTRDQSKNSATQFGVPTGSVLLDFTQNGFGSAPLQSVSVDSEGVIYGRYMNGERRPLYQVMIAKFPNQEGLRRVGKNLYVQSNFSGEPITDVPGSAGRGKITPNALEQSTVDLTKQFVTMITYQRGFQANSRVIVTSDEVTQEIVNLKR